MAMRDKTLEAKVAIQRKVNKAKLATVTANPIGNSDASTAARRTKVTAQTGDQIILDLINEINSASGSGDYYIVTDVKAGALNSVIKYFTGKNYLIASAKYKTGVKTVISWVGGKSWSKVNVSDKNVNKLTTIGSKVVSYLTSELTNKDDVPKISWINPKNVNDEVKLHKSIGQLAQKLP